MPESGVEKPVEKRRQVLDQFRHHMHHARLALQLARDPQKPPRDHRPAKAFVDIGPDHHIGRTRLILQRDEDHPLRGAGRWRTRTRPATVTRAPAGGSPSRPAGSAFGGRGQLRRLMLRAKGGACVMRTILEHPRRNASLRPLWQIRPD